MTYSKEQQTKKPDKKVKVPKPKISTCKTCKNKFEQVRSNMIVCSPKCAYEYSKKQTDRKHKQAKILERKRIREEKEKLKTLSDYLSDLQVIINEIIRILDKGLPCIASGRFEGKMTAGHYRSVGSWPSLRFHLDNIFIQSFESNSMRAGDSIRMRHGIIARYGQEYFENVVDKLPVKYPTLKATKEYVKRWIKTARKIRTRLKKGEVMTRDQINKELNIYGG